MNKVNIAIIGLGAIGERLMPIIKEHELSNIVGVFDTDKERMKEISEKFKLNTFLSVDDLINSEEVEAVYLAVPPKFHRDLALKIMKADKHILCEKPLAGTIIEAKEMAEAEKTFTKVTAMNFPLPYTAAYIELKKMLKKNIVGNIKRIEVSGLFPDWPRKWQVNPWIDTREEGGFVREVFTHFIQLIVDTFGPINKINSFAQYPEDDKLSEIGVIGWGQLSSGTPVAFNGLTGVKQEEHLSLSIYGDKGIVKIENWRQLTFKSLEKGEEIINLEDINATQSLINNFYSKINNSEGDLVTFDIGYETVKVVELLLNNN